MPEPDFPFAEIAVWSPPAGGTGAEQMALDETLLRMAVEPTLRVYRWARAEVTFGYPQRWADAEVFAAGRPLTRRCTGGGWVEHGTDLTVALAVPAAHPFARRGPTEMYGAIHEAIRRALGGGALRLATPADATAGAACFAHPAPGDVLDGARKVAGGALRRSREGVLYQGSLTTADAYVAGAFGRVVREWEPPAAWRAVFAELVRTRYGTAAWNERR